MQFLLPANNHTLTILTDLLFDLQIYAETTIQFIYIKLSSWNTYNKLDRMLLELLYNYTIYHWVISVTIVFKFWLFSLSKLLEYCFYPDEYKFVLIIVVIASNIIIGITI